MLNRTIPPPIKDAIEFDLRLKPYTLYTLKNGVQVYAIDAGAEEVLQLELLFSAGNTFENKDAVAAATNFLLKNGTRTRSAFDVNEQFEFYGAYCNRSCSNEIASVSLHTLSKHLPELLPVIKDMITESVFPGEELSIYIRNSKQKLAVNLQKCDFVANRAIDKCLYGPRHPYGKAYDAEHYDALTRDDMVEHFDKYYRNGRCIIFLAGKLPADVFRQLDDSFGALPLRAWAIQSPILDRDMGAEKKLRIQNDEKGVQGAIRIARPFPNRHHPDFTKMMLLNTVLGGYFGSRLMSNIREEKGYTYGIHSYIQNRIQDSALVISTEAGATVCEDAIREIYREMEVLRTELIDEEELLLVRNYLVGSILGDLDGPFQVIGRWKNILLNNLDESYFYRSVEDIKKTSAAELKELAEKYFRPEDFYELVVI